MKPTYFDLTVTDLPAARHFFEQVLGWKFEQFPMPYEYYRITAGELNEPGIDGGIGRIDDAPLSAGRPLVSLTVPVPDLEKVISRIVEHGGKIVEPKIPVPGIGWYATCSEPGGLMFGIIQADVDAK